VSGTITAKMVALDTDPGDWASINKAAQSAGALVVTSLTNSDLTTTRVPYATTAGLLKDEAAFAYTEGSNTLTVGTVAGDLDGATATLSSLTITRVPFASTAGLLVDSSAFTHASGLTTSTIFGGAHKDTTAAKAGDGAISSAPGTIVITKGSALGSSTLATPTVTTHDGYILRITAGTAAAHVVSCASGKVDGGTNTTLTFGGAIGDHIQLVAYQGVWYSISNLNVTLS
jgi:hypothetical protein